MHLHAGGEQGVSPKEVKRAEEFVRVLLAATPEHVCEDIGMRVLKNIPDIENRFAKLDIITPGIDPALLERVHPPD